MIRKLCFAALALAGSALSVCLLAPAAALLLTVAAHAAETVVTAPAPATAVILPYGDWIVAAGQMAGAVLVPVLSVVVMMAIRQVAPWATFFISDALVEKSLRKWLDYGVNSVKGAAPGGVYSVPVGSAVIAAALQRGVDRADASKIGKWIMDAAGGPAEAANKLFRMLKLDASASAADVLAPVHNSLVNVRK